MGENWNSNDPGSFNDFFYDGDSFDEDDRWNDDESNNHEEDLEQRVLQLRKALQAGQTECRAELVEALVNWIDILSFDQRQSEVVKGYKELIRLYTDLINDGQFEHTEALGKAYLQHAIEIAELDPEGNYCVEYQRAISYLNDLVFSGNLHCRPELAMAYMFLSDYQRSRRFSSLNAALFNAEQAIDIWRTLIEEGDLNQRSLLAAALVSKGIVLHEIGDCDETIITLKESEKIQRDLLSEEENGKNCNDTLCCNELCCDEDDDFYEKDDPAIELLRCLILQAETLAHFQKFVQAHLLFDEVIDFCRILEKTHSDAIYGWLPILLVDKARIYRECWQFSAALKVYELAIDEYEKTRLSDTEKYQVFWEFLPDNKILTDIDEIDYHALEQCLWDEDIDTDNICDNEDVYENESDDHIKRPSQTSDESKNKLSTSFEEKEFHAELFDKMFRESAKNSVSTRRCPEFIRENWNDYVDLQLAHIHSSRGCLFHDLDRFESSVTAFDDALTHYRTVEKRGKVDVEVDICLVQLNRAKSLLAIKLGEEAVEIQHEAIEQLCHLIERGRTKLRINLAQALRELAISLDLLDDKMSALEKIDASIELWREILDEGNLENREQLAHSLLVRSDFLLERGQADESLKGYLESCRIRKDLFCEGDWLVALPMVQTMFNLARNYYHLKDDQQALFWCIEALNVLEKIRKRRLICVDAYILEGARRCLGILLNIQNPDVVLEEIEKIFHFIEQIRDDEQSRDVIDAMFPYFQMYKALAWRMKGCLTEETQSLLQAVDAWEHLLEKENTQARKQEFQNEKLFQKTRENMIGYLSELEQSLVYLAEAYAEQGQVLPELQAYRKIKHVFDRLQKLGVNVSREKRCENSRRIARISKKKV